jgi:hypothetical protein
MASKAIIRMEDGMNINSLIFMIENVDDGITKSGFYRDIQEYQNTLAQTQNNSNIVLLKDIVNKLIENLRKIIEMDIPNDISHIIVRSSIPKFAPEMHIERLTTLLVSPELSTSQIYSTLSQILGQITNELTPLNDELKKLNDVLLPYYKKSREVDADATLSLIFKDEKTILNLKQFGKAISKWNRAINVFQQLISSEAPEDIKLVNIQNGSLDVVLNINIDVALNLAEVFKYAMISFGGYLTYKKAILPITKTYLGNRKLIDSEKEREKYMLENIGQAVKEKILELHKDRIKADKRINIESIDKKIEEVGGLVTEHVIKGNEIKLLIDFKEKDDEESKGKQELVEEVKKESVNVRRDMRELSIEDKTLLIEMYKTKDE